MIEHEGKVPRVHASAYIAPNATLCGDVRVGANSQILFGAVISAEGAAVEIGKNCVVMENAVLRGTPKHPLTLGDNVLVGPHAHLTGCTVDNNAFLATGCSVFTGAHIGADAEVRINGVVHLKTFLPSGETVPIGWVAVGNPCQIFPADRHDAIWKVQKPLNFPKTVFGVDRPTEGRTIMPDVMPRYASSLGKHHGNDKVIK